MSYAFRLRSFWRFIWVKAYLNISEFVMKVEVRCEVCEGLTPDQATKNFCHNGDLKQGGQ